MKREQNILDTLPKKTPDGIWHMLPCPRTSAIPQLDYLLDWQCRSEHNKRTAKRSGLSHSRLRFRRVRLLRFLLGAARARRLRSRWRRLRSRWRRWRRWRRRGLLQSSASADKSADKNTSMDMFTRSFALLGREKLQLRCVLCVCRNLFSQCFLAFDRPCGQVEWSSISLQTSQTANFERNGAKGLAQI